MLEEEGAIFEGGDVGVLLVDGTLGEGEEEEVGAVLDIGGWMLDWAGRRLQGGAGEGGVGTGEGVEGSGEKGDEGG